MASSIVWTLTESKLQNRENSKIYKAAWTAHTDGSVTSVATGSDVFGFVVRVVTDPGGTAPTANYDITITDEDGCDILGGEGANRSATASEQIIPKLGNSYAPCFVNGNLTLNLSGNSVSGAGGTVILYVEN